MKFTVKKVLLLMLLGALLYLLLGAILPFTAHPEVSEETRRAVAETAYTGSEQGTERARIIADNGEALTRRLQMISQAKERIILSTFDIRSDESGKDVLAALIAAADRGVEVKLVVDGFCGFTRMTGDPYFVTLSARKNAEIKIYNPVNPLKPWTLMARLHDKYLIVDNTAYLLGGRNTHDYFLGDHDGKQNYDWDVLVWQALCTSFLTTLRRSGILRPAISTMMMSKSWRKSGWWRPRLSWPPVSWRSRRPIPTGLPP